MNGEYARSKSENGYYLDPSPDGRDHGRAVVVFFWRGFDIPKEEATPGSENSSRKGRKSGCRKLIQQPLDLQITA